MILCVYCTELNEPVFSVRLRGGDRPTSGAIEVYYGGVWGSVCSDNWDETEANVICRQLGYGPALNTDATIQSYTQPILTWFKDVNCHGNESSIDQCSLDGWGKIFNCPAGHIAMATCSSEY